MKLTNRQLDVITNSIVDKIRNKEREFKNSQEYQEEYNNMVEDLKSDILPIVEKIAAKQEEIEDLGNEAKDIASNVGNLSFGFHINDPNRVSRDIKRFVENHIIKSKNWFHTKPEIEKSIVLTSMKDFKNLLESVEERLNL